MIRRATIDDLALCVEHGAKFHAYSIWKDIPYDAEATGRFIAGLIEHGAVFLSDDGMIGGLLNPLYFNPAYVMGVELFWWAPKEGRALRLAFEQWADEQGAHGHQLGCLADDKAPLVTRLLRRAGYVPVETGFLKRIDR